MNITEILAEDALRRSSRDCPYNPIVGNSNEPGRVQVSTPMSDYPVAYVPSTMVDDPSYAVVQGNPLAWERLRIRHDFEFWAARCVTIKHKLDGVYGPFILNAPQRRVLSALESDRRAGRPIRLIMLKARQWGGSTLVQTYMAWIQTCLRRNWNSIICSQVKDTSSGIRGMFATLLKNYPPELWDGEDMESDGGKKKAGDSLPSFKPFERSLNVREITGRGCRVTVSSIENQDAVRGADYAMAHLSEVAFWRATPLRSPEDVIRSICGAIALQPDTLIALESTANGTGNFFHREWIRCRDGHGDKRAVFVPWYEIEIYRLEPPDRAAFAASLSPYEQQLWEDFGCALDQIYWYHAKSLEYSDHDRMMAEFPTTDTEAFNATGAHVFPRAGIESLRQGCAAPARGYIDGRYEWCEDADGEISMWQLPSHDGSYVAAVDIGGRSAKADWSVIAVLRVDGVCPEVVAQWRGHIDHDILADKAMRLGLFYNEALLVVESNSLESSGSGTGLFILDRLSECYPNLYRRSAGDGGESSRVGFHTNRATKEVIVSNLIEAVRDGGYVERDSVACDELSVYEQRSDGSYAAKDGCHDDILMTRAIALYVARGMTPVPPLTPTLPVYW